MSTLEQIIEAVRSLPLEDRRSLFQWLQNEERQTAEERQGDFREQSEAFQRAMKWIDEHRAEYLGQWVALDGDRLLSHGSDARQAHKEAKTAGISAPFVELVTEEDGLPFCGGWLP